jgi:hypothetical protein
MKPPEQVAREIERMALKDHDDGGYQFEGMSEILETRIAAALTEVFTAAWYEAIEECAKVAEGFAGEHGPTHNKNMGGFKIAELIRALAKTGGGNG